MKRICIFLTCICLALPFVGCRVINYNVYEQIEIENIARNIAMLAKVAKDERDMIALVNDRYAQLYRGNDYANLIITGLVVYKYYNLHKDDLSPSALFNYTKEQFLSSNKQF